MPKVNKAAAGTERVQYGVLPYAVQEDGTVRLLLVTSRETQRWVVPKGWPMESLKPHEAAAREAFEEAGIVGKAKKRAIGAYQYWKRLESSFTLCRVEVFPLLVERLEKSWPEQKQRDRRWFELEDAALLVDEPGLEALIRSFVAN
jgi:8-oxo-dGTP pyrophosphatase MutT (NUDIX family)